MFLHLFVCSRVGMDPLEADDPEGPWDPTESDFIPPSPEGTWDQTGSDIIPPAPKSCRLVITTKVGGTHPTGLHTS